MGNMFSNDTDLKSIMSGRQHMLCPCPDCGCVESPINDPGPPSNCGWVYYWEFSTVDPNTPVLTGSFGMPGATPSPIALPDIAQAGPGHLKLLVQPVVSVVPAGILFNAFNPSGDFLNPVDNSPATVPVPTIFTLGEIDLNTAELGAKAVGMKAESQCGDLQVDFTYNVV